MGLGYSPHRLGEQRLALARRPEQQKALGGAYAKPVKGSRVLERQFHALAQLVASFVDAADVAPADIRHLHHDFAHGRWLDRSEEHTSELQSLMRISYAVFCLNK